MRRACSRRDVLGAGVSLAALGAASPLFAGQSLEDVGKLLGGKLPQQLQTALPQELGEIARIVAEVAGLEKRAGARQLPQSPLSQGKGGIPADPNRFYEVAMPHLVALIDRAGRIDPQLGNDAGALLARLHRTQYDPPDAWFGDHAVAAPYVRDGGNGLLHLPSLPVRPQRLADTPDQDAPLALPGAEPDEAPDAAVPTRATKSLKFEDISDEYGQWFTAAKIRPEHQESADWHLTMFRQSRERYEAVGKPLGIPWYFIAAVHGLEASFNFRAHLHNGDFPLTQRTRQVPAGRPLRWLPPSDWEDSARDALRLMGFAGQADWGLARVLYRLEAYNGFGYRRAGRISPYLWSFSNLYDRGKFVADGRFDPRAKSQQCGAAVMLKVLANAGDLIGFG